MERRTKNNMVANGGSSRARWCVFAGPRGCPFLDGDGPRMRCRYSGPGSQAASGGSGGKSIERAHSEAVKARRTFITAGRVMCLLSEQRFEPHCPHRSAITRPPFAPSRARILEIQTVLSRFINRFIA